MPNDQKLDTHSTEQIFATSDSQSQQLKNYSNEIQRLINEINQKLNPHSFDTHSSGSQSQQLKNYSNELQKQINELEKEANNILSFYNPNIFFPLIILISGLTAATSLVFGVNTPLLLGCAVIGIGSGILHFYSLYNLIKSFNDSLTDDRLQDTFLLHNSPLPLDHTTDSATLDSLQQTKAITESSQQNHGHSRFLFFRNTSKSADPNEAEQIVSHQPLKIILDN